MDSVSRLGRAQQDLIIITLATSSYQPALQRKENIPVTCGLGRHLDFASKFTIHRGLPPPGVHSL